MAKAIYEKYVLDANGDIVVGAEYDVIDESTGLDLTPIYSDRNGAVVLTPPYLSDSNGLIRFYVDPGLTYKVEVTGGSGTGTSRYNEARLFGTNDGETPTNEESNSQRVRSIASVANLSGLTGVDGQQISINEYAPGDEANGGVFVYSESTPKSAHDGKNIFSPTVPYSSDADDFVNAVGETDPTGNGCWIRREKYRQLLEPIVIVSTGQSNCAGVYDGGPNPANPSVRVWDGVTNDWGSSDYTQNPFARNNPDGNTGNNNISLALAHRLTDETLRPVYVIYDAVGGTSIDEWVGAGTSSARYAAIVDKVNLALASPELSGVTTVDAIHWQQGEEDALTSDFEDYYTKLTTLVSQFRAESWVEDVTPYLIGAPSMVLHERYMPKHAMKQFCNKEDAFAVFVNSAGLETELPDTTHYTGISLWEMGYYRMFEAFESAPYNNEVDAALFYGRGVGPARPDDRTQIASASTLVSWDSKTSEFPVNANAATGSISWGFECDADGNYTYAMGYQNTTDNLCNYTAIFGREMSATADGDYSGGFGLDNVLGAPYTFAVGRGHITSSDYEVCLGSFTTYTTPQSTPVRAQIGTGTSTGNRQNGITVREGGTVEIYAPSTADDPAQREEIVFKRIDNFTIRLTMKGTDDVQRSVDLTLA